MEEILIKLNKIIYTTNEEKFISLKKYYERNKFLTLKQQNWIEGVYNDLFEIDEDDESLYGFDRYGMD